MSKYALTLLIILTCVFNVCTVGSQPSFDIEKLSIEVGMKRSVLEKNIAKYIELKSDYSTQYPAESSTSITYVIKTIIY